MNTRKLFSRKFIIAILLLISIAFISMTMVQYNTYLKSALQDLDQSMDAIAASILDRLATIDKLYYVLELQIDDEMEQVLRDVNEAYRAAGDLSFSLEEFLGPDHAYDIYIFDKNNTIIKSTDPVDMGLDFGTDNEFGDFLTQVRRDNRYYPERIAIASLSPTIKKYSYMGSYDHEYLFETGYKMSTFEEILGGDSFTNLTSENLNDFSNILSIRVLNPYGLSFNDDFVLEKSRNTRRYEAFMAAQETKVMSDRIKEKKDGYVDYYVYLPYEVSDIASNRTTFIVEMGYTDENIRRELRQVFTVQLGIILFFIFLVMLALWYFENRFINPLKTLLHGIARVRDKELDTRVHLQVENELKLVSETFNEMVANLQGTLQAQERTKAELEEALTTKKIAYFETIRALSNSIDAKDNYTRGHCDRVMEMTMLLGNHLKLDEDALETLKYGSILHDIGKIGIEDSILNKTGKYEASEYEKMKAHPEIGYQIVKDVAFLQQAREIILAHHERIDGLGYPHQLKEQEIPYLAKIISITDAFDAMTSKRVYRAHRLTVKEAFDEMKKNSNRQFDQELVKAFIEAYTNKFGHNLDHKADQVEEKMKTTNEKNS